MHKTTSAPSTNSSTYAVTIPFRKSLFFVINDKGDKPFITPDFSDFENIDRLCNYTFESRSLFWQSVDKQRNKAQLKSLWNT